jgi:hypothetical protein
MSECVYYQPTPSGITVSAQVDCVTIGTVHYPLGKSYGNRTFTTAHLFVSADEARELSRRLTEAADAADAAAQQGAA